MGWRGWPRRWSVLALAAVCLVAIPGTDAVTPAGGHRHQESFLYVAAVNSGGTDDPDFIALVGADPAKKDFGKIIDRVDMPYVGDNLHHFGYSADRRRLLVPGLHSDRLHVFDVTAPKNPRLLTYSDLGESGYMMPHSVLPRADGTALVTMLGADTPSTAPGGIIVVDDRTGTFERCFGYCADRSIPDGGPAHMYDLSHSEELNLAVSTTAARPISFKRGIPVPDHEVAVWDWKAEKVIQKESLGPGSGAIAVHWIRSPGARHGFLITLRGEIWLFEDDDDDGTLRFHLLEAGLAAPGDMVVSPDQRFLFVSQVAGSSVQVWDVTNKFDPRLVEEEAVHHPLMVRVTGDQQRLYVTNSVTAAVDDTLGIDADYGIYLFSIAEDGTLTSSTPDRRDGFPQPWVDFMNVQKKFTRGPAGPHMILFDPGVPPSIDEH